MAHLDVDGRPELVTILVRGGKLVPERERELGDAGGRVGGAGSGDAFGHGSTNVHGPIRQCVENNGASSMDAGNTTLPIVF